MKLKTSLPVIRTETLTEKFGSVRLNEQRTTDPGSWLIDPVDDEDVEEIVHELILQTSDNVRSKEMEELVHSS